MDKPDPDPSIAIATLERLGATLPHGAIAALLGDLERVRATLTARMIRETIAASAPASTSPVDELRHLTPAQVAELLNLKEPYVHELCRSRRLPAMKSGKYWIISVTGLRQWLGSGRDGIDDARGARLESRHLRSRGARAAGATGRTCAATS
jgi:excisionase family DNA binding protein